MLESHMEDCSIPCWSCCGVFCRLGYARITHGGLLYPILVMLCCVLKAGLC